MRGHRVGIALFWTLLNATDAIPWVINGWRSFASCEKRAGREASLLFEKAIGNGFPIKHGLSRLTDDLRTGALSLSESPHVYALVGGGEWGPRFVAKALLESIYRTEPWHHVVVIDLEEAVAQHREKGLEEAQQWIKGKVASVIRQCPGKAAVVFDKAHVIEGDDLLLLDPLLLLFDDNRSHMDESSGKVSGDGSIFLLLLNEDSSKLSDDLDAKVHLQHIWDYEGPAFTTNAFVGRVDAAVMLSALPRLSPSDQAAIEGLWLKTTQNDDFVQVEFLKKFSDLITSPRALIPLAIALLLASVTCTTWGYLESPDKRTSAGDCIHDHRGSDCEENSGGGRGMARTRGGSQSEYGNRGSGQHIPPTDTKIHKLIPGTVPEPEPNKCVGCEGSCESERADIEVESNADSNVNGGKSSEKSETASAIGTELRAECNRDAEHESAYDVKIKTPTEEYANGQAEHDAARDECDG